jgi:cullin 4
MLLGRSASDDFEKEVLRVLSECKLLPNPREIGLMLMLMQWITAYDAAFGDLTQMFSDLAVSKDLVDDYRNVKEGRPDRPDAALSVMVLQHSVWPVIRKVVKSETGVEIVLPSKVRRLKISQR